MESEIADARADARRSSEALQRAEEAIRQEETVARLKLVRTDRQCSPRQQYRFEPSLFESNGIP